MENKISKYFAYLLTNLLATIWLICQCRRCKRHGFSPWMGNSPGEENSVFVINKMPADQTPLLFAPHPCLQGARVHPLFLTASQAVHCLVLAPLSDSLQSRGLHLGESQHQRLFLRTKLWSCAWVWGFPGGTSGKEPNCQCRRRQRPRFDPWVGKITSGKEPICQCRRRQRPRFDPWVGKLFWRRKWKPTQYSCLEKPVDRGT